MKKCLFMGTLVISLLSLSGCNKDDATGVQAVKLTASADQDVDTRTLMNISGNKGIIKWESGDQINVNGVLSTGGDATDGDDGEANFYFSNSITSPYYAYYPGEKVTVFPNTGTATFTVTLPSEQPYRAEASGCFAKSMNPSVAYTATGSVLNFRNLCGYLRVTLKKAVNAAYATNFEEVAKATFTSAGEKVSGTANVAVNTTDVALSTIKVDASGSTTVTVTGINKDLNNGTITVYFVLPPSSGTGYAANWSIQLYNASGTLIAQKTGTKKLIITRNRTNTISSLVFDSNIELPTPGTLTTAPRIYYDPTTDALQLTTDINNHGLYFKFGGVIGVRSHMDDPSPTYNNGDVKFNPSSVSLNVNWNTIPSQNTLGSGTTIVHNLASVQAGKGDPCKLVGIPLSVIRSATTDAQVDNKLYRTPTDTENGTWGNSTNASTEFDDTNKGWASKLGFLPAAGCRDYGDGTTLYQGDVGFYWSSTSHGSGNGHALYFDSTDLFYPQSGGNNHYGFSVRCVAQP